MVLQECHRAVRRAETAPELASIMAMQPSVLILDEPTSQLDPIAAADFWRRWEINRELGTTVVLTEHRLEDALPVVSRVAVMDRAGCLHRSPAEVGRSCGRDTRVPGHANPDDLHPRRMRADTARSRCGGPGLADEVRGWTPPDGVAV